MLQTRSHSSRYREHVIDALRTLIADRDGGINYMQQAGRDRSGNQALDTLKALTATGLVTHEGLYEAVGYYPTVAGLDFLERHEHSVKVWLGDNWFALIVAGVASAIGLANVVVTLLNFLSANP